MSIVFSDNFDAGGWTWDGAGWTSREPDEQELLAGRGVSGTTCFGCACATLRKDVTPATAGAVRARLAAVAGTASDVLFQSSVLQAFDPIEGFVCGFTLFGDGHIQVTMGGIASDQFDTAPGTFPMDGTWVGVQLAFDLPTRTFALVLNDVAVLTGTCGGFVSVDWSSVFVTKGEQPVSSRSDPYGLGSAMVVAIDDVEIDDSDAIVSWPAGAGPPLTLDACGLLFSDHFAAAPIESGLWDEFDPEDAEIDASAGVFETPECCCGPGGFNVTLAKTLEPRGTPATVIATVAIAKRGDTTGLEYAPFTIQNSAGGPEATFVIQADGTVLARIATDDGIVECIGNTFPALVEEDRTGGHVLLFSVTFGTISQSVFVARWDFENENGPNIVLLEETVGGITGAPTWDQLIARAIQEPEGEATRLIGHLDNVVLWDRALNYPLAYAPWTSSFDRLSIDDCSGTLEDCAVATEIDVINDGLGKIGVSQMVEALDEGTEQAIRGHFFYPKARKETLRYHPWQFARKYASAVDAVNPGDPMELVDGSEDDPVNADWTYAYRLPSDCLFARRLVTTAGKEYNPSPAKWEIGRRATADPQDDYLVLFTNEVDAVLEYTADVECDLSDDLFNDALGWKMAEKLAPSMSRNKMKAVECMKAFEFAILRAVTVDSRERQQAKPGEASWTDDR